VIPIPAVSIEYEGRPGINTLTPDPDEWGRLGAAIRARIESLGLPVEVTGGRIIVRGAVRSSPADLLPRLVLALAAVVHHDLMAGAAQRCTAKRRQELHAAMARAAIRAWADAMAAGVFDGVVSKNFRRGRDFAEKRKDREREQDIDNAKRRLGGIEDPAQRQKIFKETVSRLAGDHGISEETVREKWLAGYGRKRGRPSKEK
jgi:hypothetical protein